MVCSLGMMRCFQGFCLGAQSASAFACNNEMDVVKSNSAVLFLW